jgi:phospholipase D1/2
VAIARAERAYGKHSEVREVETLSGRESIRRLAGRRIAALSRRKTRRGRAAVAAAHLIPMARFTIVSLILGASRMRLKDFILGTIIGLGPGILLL